MAVWEATPNRDRLRPAYPGLVLATTLNGQMFGVHVCFNDTVMDAKFMLERLTGISWREQRLLLGTTCLSNDDKPWMSRYLVSNEELKSSAQGVSLRSSMQLHDKARRGPRSDHDNVARCGIVRWGAGVLGVQASSDWVSVGDLFLPIRLKGKRVLFEADKHFEVVRQQDCPADAMIRLTLVRIDPEIAAALEQVQIGADGYVGLPEHIRKVREVALAAVRADGYLINYEHFGDGGIPHELRADQEISLVALRQVGAPWLFEFLPQELKTNAAFVLKVLHINPHFLEYVGENLKDNREIVLSAVRRMGTSLVYASANMKNNREVVVAALHNDGSALEHASGNLQNDRAIVSLAVEKTGAALRFASEECRNDQHLALTALLESTDAIEFVGRGLQDNSLVVLAAIEEDFDDYEVCSSQDSLGSIKRALSFASPTLLSTRKFWRKAVKKHVHAFRWRPSKFKRDQGLIFQHRAKLRRMTS